MGSNIWNPWHGCHKVSEGCRNCYMYYLDGSRGRTVPSSEITRNKNDFNLPVKKDRQGFYKIPSGSRFRVCMTSDFFLEEADPWREEAWQIIKSRPDVCFWLLTKRPQRVLYCLPDHWDDGWDNVWLGVSAEDQQAANERVPLLLSLPIKHRHICCAPLIGPVDLSPYLSTGQIHQVCAGGENYDGCRPCDYVWAHSLWQQCRTYDTQFCFYETGTVFVKDGCSYRIPSKRAQSEQAYYSGLHYEPSVPVKTDLRLPDGTPVPERTPLFPKSCCEKCANKYMCGGCLSCGLCIHCC